MLSKTKYAFVLLFLLSITSLTLQGMVLSCLQDGNVVKKQLCSNNIPVSEEEEDETSKAEEELFLSTSPVFVLMVNSLDVAWPRNILLPYHNHLNIQTPPPEL